MCVINLGEVQKKPVMGWKLFGRGLTGLCYGPFGEFGIATRYKVGEIYQSKQGPGFQAFVSKKDAQVSKRAGWGRSLQVYRVRLYEARKGIIERMDKSSEGKPGWCAIRMRVLPQRKRKVKRGCGARRKA